MMSMPSMQTGLKVLWLGLSLIVVSLVSGQPNRPPPDFLPPPLPQDFQSNAPVSSNYNDDDIVDSLVLVDEPIQQVYRIIEELTGKMIVAQGNAPQVRINFNSRGSLTRKEAILALETLLSLNGITMTSLGEKFLRVVPTSSIRYQSPDMINGSTLDLPPSGRYYAKIYKLNYISVEDAVQIVNNIATPGLHTQVILSKSKALMVVDLLTNLQQIERIFTRVDVPTQLEEEMLFKSLSYISAVELKDRLTNMAQTSLNRYLGGNTFFEADERTNQIIILTQPRNVPLINQIIESLDVDSAPLTKTEVFYIKHAEAKEVATLLNALIRGQTINTGANVPGGATNPANRPETTPNPIQNTANLSARQDLEGQQQFSEYITIESDERSNAVLAYGTASDIRYIADVIDQIDIVLDQVKIDVIIAEVNIGNTNNRGIDRFGINLDSAKEITIGLNQLVGTDNSFGSPAADLPIRVGATLEAFTLNTVFQTAQTDSDVSILSTPSLMTTHNRKAVISSGERRPIITGTSTDNIGTSIRSSVDLTEIGIELTVTPLIGKNGVVQLEIEQTVETVTGTTTIDGNEQPIIGSRSATSFVSVADGQVIVLGGLQEQETRITENRIWLLGQIPLLGDWLFSSKTEQVNNQDLVIFIRPQIIYSSEDASRVSEETIRNNEREGTIRNFLDTGNLEEPEAGESP